MPQSLRLVPGIIFEYKTLCYDGLYSKNVRTPASP